MDSKINLRDETPRDKLVIKVGSRKSQLALIQTQRVIDQLSEFYANNPDRLEAIMKKKCKTNVEGLEFHIVSMSTTGDNITDRPLPTIGTKSLFTRELEVALIDKQVDFVAHSLKDLPTSLPQGCCIGAVLRRDSREDSMILKSSSRSKLKPLDLLFEASLTNDNRRYRLGTSSQRRIAMIKRCNPNLECIDIRGNLNTRIAKLDREDGEYDAIVLAKAGLDRMGWSDRSSLLLNSESDPRLSDWCYAVGQGAIAVECRDQDEATIDLLMPIAHLPTTYEVIAERRLMKKLEAGCSVPLGVRSTWSRDGDNENTLNLKAIVLSADGGTTIGHEAMIKLPSIDDHEDNCAMDEASDNTGIVLSRDLPNCHAVKKNMKICSDLGNRLANEMIKSGCLELIER